MSSTASRGNCGSERGSSETGGLTSVRSDAFSRAGGGGGGVSGRGIDGSDGADGFDGVESRGFEKS
jgi:hypothetical protein